MVTPSGRCRFVCYQDVSGARKIITSAHIQYGLGRVTMAGPAIITVPIWLIYRP